MIRQRRGTNEHQICLHHFLFLRSLSLPPPAQSLSAQIHKSNASFESFSVDDQLRFSIEPTILFLNYEILRNCIEIYGIWNTQNKSVAVTPIDWCNYDYLETGRHLLETGVMRGTDWPANKCVLIECAQMQRLGAGRKCAFVRFISFNVSQIQTYK